ncbi:MAG: Sec-independent protein translocase protein TatB [Pseudoxanthomonas sp.]
MFDIGFTELLVIAVVALVVLGPERLPKAARFAGLWVRRARAQWDSVKGELERELAAEELKRSLREAQGVVDQVKRGVHETGAQVQRELAQAQAAVEEGVAPVAAPTEPVTTDAAVVEAPIEPGGETPAEIADDASVEAPAEAPEAEPADDVQPDLFSAPPGQGRP